MNGLRWLWLAWFSLCLVGLGAYIPPEPISLSSSSISRIEGFDNYPDVQFYGLSINESPGETKYYISYITGNTADSFRSGKRISGLSYISWDPVLRKLMGGHNKNANYKTRAYSADELRELGLVLFGSGGKANMTISFPHYRANEFALVNSTYRLKMNPRGKNVNYSFRLELYNRIYETGEYRIEVSGNFESILDYMERLTAGNHDSGELNQSQLVSLYRYARNLPFHNVSPGYLYTNWGNEPEPVYHHPPSIPHYDPFPKPTKYNPYRTNQLMWDSYWHRKRPILHIFGIGPVKAWKYMDKRDFWILIFVSILTEFLVVFLLFQMVIRKNSEGIRNLLKIFYMVAIASALTMALDWWILSIFILSALTRLIMMIAFAVLIKACLYARYLKVTQRQALYMSLAANLVSYGCGVLLFGRGVVCYRAARRCYSNSDDNEI